MACGQAWGEWPTSTLNIHPDISNGRTSTRLTTAEKNPALIPSTLSSKKRGCRSRGVNSLPATLVARNKTPPRVSCHNRPPNDTCGRWTLRLTFIGARLHATRFRSGRALPNDFPCPPPPKKRLRRRRLTGRTAGHYIPRSLWGKSQVGCPEPVVVESRLLPSV